MRRQYEEQGFVFRPELLAAMEAQALNTELDRLLKLPHDEIGRAHV